MSMTANALGSGSGSAEDFLWREQKDPAAWDLALAKLGGHPLQSARWGNARREADGIEDRRFMAEGRFGTLMARIELRRVPIVRASVGWIPRGPSGPEFGCNRAAFRALAGQLDPRPILFVSDRWKERTESPCLEDALERPETIWLDLSGGQEVVWRQFDSAFRQGVRKSVQAGVTVEQTSSDMDRDRFIELTRRIGAQKGFELVLSRHSLEHLMLDGANAVSAHLFVARCKRDFAATALIMKCGRSIHYISGGTDREYSRQRVGEALHWFIIQWAIGEGISLYDLEGIDRRRNPGTFAFKKKMGGREVTLSGKQYHALSSLGHVVAAIDRRRDRLVAIPRRTSS